MNLKENSDMYLVRNGIWESKRKCCNKYSGSEINTKKKNRRSCRATITSTPNFEKSMEAIIYCQA